MPQDITDQSQFTDPLQAPVTSDNVTAAAMLGFLQGLANRTRYLYNNLGQLPSLAANRVLGRKSTGAVGGQPATDFAFEALALSTAVAWVDKLLTKGSSISASTTTNLAAATGAFVHVTGTTTIESFGTATAGVVRRLRFAQSLTLRNNAAILLPAPGDIQTAADDTLIAVSEGSGVWRVLAYQRNSGEALSVATGGVYAVQRTINYDDVDVVTEYEDDQTIAIDLGSPLPAGAHLVGTSVASTNHWETGTAQSVDLDVYADTLGTATGDRLVNGLDLTDSELLPAGSPYGYPNVKPVGGAQLTAEITSDATIAGFSEGNLTITVLYTVPVLTTLSAS